MLIQQSVSQLTLKRSPTLKSLFPSLLAVIQGMDHHQRSMRRPSEDEDLDATIKGASKNPEDYFRHGLPPTDKDENFPRRGTHASAAHSEVTSWVDSDSNVDEDEGRGWHRALTSIGRYTGSMGNRRKQQSSNAKFLKNLKVEMQSVCRLRDSNVILTYGFCMQPHQVMVVMELMSYGSLYDMLHNETLDMDEDMCVDVLNDITGGMAYLHSQKPEPHLHRFLSSSNVLLDRNLSAKISDIGFPRVGTNVARSLQRVRQDIFRTSGIQLTAASNAPDESWVTPALAYLSPEVLNTGNYTAADDVYAFGVLCHEVLVRQDPYSGNDTSLLNILCEVAELKLDFTKRLPFPPSINPSLAGLCRDCTRLHGSLRPQFDEVERRIKSLARDDGGGGGSGGFAPEGLMGSFIMNPSRRRTVRKSDATAEDATNSNRLLLQVKQRMRGCDEVWVCAGINDVGVMIAAGVMSMFLYPSSR